jgi:hypothetical protein
MRPITMLASSLLIAAPLLSIGSPARADNNDFVGQAQRFLNNRGDDRDARNSYERGREDEMRRQQAEQDRNRYRHDRERDADRDDRYREPNYGYNGNYR